MQKDLHVGTTLFYGGTLLFLALFLRHPFFLFSLFLAVGLVLLSCDLQEKWLLYLKFGFIFLFLIMLVNFLFVREGLTVLWAGPVLPLWGRLYFTSEALCFGLGMGLRLLVLLSIFCLIVSVLPRDDLLRFLGKRAAKLALILSLSFRLFPVLRTDLLRIKEVQQCRGVNWQARRFREKVRQVGPLLPVLLLASLERAFQLAEALQARGYGLGQPSYYHRTSWQLRDYLITGCVFCGLFLSLWLRNRGVALYHYYPRLESVNVGEFYWSLGVGLFFTVPAFLNWGWKRWPSLKSKI